MAGLKGRENKLAKLIGLAVLTGLLVVLVLAGREQQGQAGGDFQKYNGKTFLVHRVIDGDTIDLDVPDGNEAQTRVRLWGVDTPETKAWGKPVAYFGPEATALAEKMVAGQTVKIELQAENTRGKFGRLLAFVYTEEGKMLNEELLRSGLAYYDNRWRHRFYFHFKEVAARARKNKLGLWKAANPEDMPRHVRQRLGGDG
jgi:micrococcal nuclease